MRAGRGRGFARSTIHSRLGPSGIANPVTGGSIHSRLGTGGNLKGFQRGRGATFNNNPVARAAEMNSSARDARQNINLNRVIAGRVADAREKIELKRSKKFQIAKQLGIALPHSSETLSTRSRPGVLTRSAGGRGRGEFSFLSSSTSPIKTLKITTSNSPSGAGGLFRSAVSGLTGSQWDYRSPSPPLRSSSTTTTILTRTVPNPGAKFRASTQPGLTSSFTRMTSSSSGLYSSPKIQSIGIRPLANNSDRLKRREEPEDDDVMMRDLTIEDNPYVLRSSVKARLDSPSKFKVNVSNLQASVTTEDIVELFADVGDLVSARVVGTGLAEAYYRTKDDCHKAIEAYHNRLLDGSPMKVILTPIGGDETSGSSTSNTARRSQGVISGLKSAGGATMKIPKSSPNPNLKIHPDISAIHKVLFQPSSSANSTKMLFNKGK